MPACVFLSKADAEGFEPHLPAHLISIADSAQDQALIDHSRWSSVSYHHFTDAGFDEEVLSCFIGAHFEREFSDYILAEKARDLRERIHQATARGELIVVNSHAGRSRSAAVARYIETKYGYSLTAPTPDANLCVFRMLVEDPALMYAYANAVHPLSEPPKQRVGLFGWVRSRLQNQT